jgi:prepilin-type N-terminal cleavage/methylation domain-containing protein
MRRGYTLIEIIITVAITGILSVGMFKAFEAITLRSEKAKILTTLSIDSQSALDQISLLLYNRAPMSVVGFNKEDILPPHDQLEDETNATILQWYGTASESYNAGDYSGFIDIKNTQTNRLTGTLYSPDTWFQKITDTQNAKWGSHDLGLVFSGSFEKGDNNRTEPYIITISENHKIVFDPSDIPDKIYEKYYLVDSAYAVTRKADASSCAKTSGYSDDTLLLFYNYRPWKNQNFCDGNVSVLAANVNAFRAQMINGTIRLGIDMNRAVRGGNPVRLSKQKVVF